MSVANADYSDLISYCAEVVIDGRLLQATSSSISSMELKANLGFNVVFINSFDRRLVNLIYGTLKDDRPQLVLNQDRDLLHPGIYFIVDIQDFPTFHSAFNALSLSRRDSDFVTLNYRLDYFLFEHFKRYDHDELLVILSKYVMDNGMDRNIIMNSVLDWMLNSGITVFSREQFKAYVRACHGMYLPSIPHEPETFDLNRITDRNSRSEAELRKLDLSPLIDRYQATVRNWSCMEIADKDIGKRIVETYEATLSSAQLHSAFENDTVPFSNFYYLFESIFNATLLRYRERGLLYHSLMRIMNA